MRPEAEPDNARALACLYCTPGQRALLAALCALEREIAASLAPGLDHEVAHARLAWWRDECARCAQGQPAHPLTREIAARCPHPQALSGLSGLVDTAVWDLAAATFQTRRELAAYCERWSAAMIGPWVRAAAPAAEWAALRALGALLRESELLLALPAEARAGRLRLPLDELAGVHAGPEALARPPWSAKLTGLVRERHQRLQAALRAGSDSLPAPGRSALRALAVWAAVAAAQSRRAQRRLPDASPGRDARSPWDGWHAWRAARRAGTPRA